MSSFEDGRTHVGRINTVPGGVGRNIAEALVKLGHNPFLITTIGNDAFGRTLLDDFKSYKLDTSGITILTEEMKSTAIYSAILNERRECVFGIGDMTLYSQITPNLLSQFTKEIKLASIVLIDGNLPIETMSMVMKICKENNIPLWFEPTEVRKAQKILQVSKDFWSSLTFMSPNLKELQSLTDVFLPSSVNQEQKHNSMNKCVKNSATLQDGELSESELKVIASQCFVQFIGLRLILLTRGKNGFVIAFRQEESRNACDISLFYFPPPSIQREEIQSVSGAGDCLNAGFISGLLEGKSINQSGVKATTCAKASLMSSYNVPPFFNSKIT